MSENLYKQRVLQARKKFLELTQKNEEELLNIYQEASKVILEEIRKNKELDIETEYLEKLNKSMKQYEEDLNNRLASNINKNIEEVSNIATDIQLAYVEAIASDEHIKTIFKRATLASTKKALEKIVRGNFYADGKSLDNRIWNITKKNIEDIDKLIKGNISRGANARKLAEQLERYINPNKRIEAKTLEAGMNSSISYQSQRLARTSISHAFSETCVENAKVNPFNKGLKWNLSPSHFERQVKKWGEDICDVYANQDDYRLGKGVFPAEEFPLKHPNCLCFSVYINTPIKDASTELKEWSMGAKNDKLDKWYDKHNNGNKYNSKAYNELAISKDDNGILSSKEWLKSSFSSQKKFEQHFKHLKEYNNITPEEYLDIARKLLAEPLSEDIEGFVSSMGWVFKYRKSTNDFVMGHPEGTISTLFKPDIQYEYWLIQIEKFKA
ncbi:MAG: hypothetical protein ACRCXT_20885 [Paraclostridium sp.]